jgi:uncharacterized membrane protein YqaE (UPF0057 family)
MVITLLPFLAYIAGIIPIIAACVIFALLFSDIFKILPTLIEVAFELLDPMTFLKDLVHGIIIGIQMIFRGMFDIFFGKLQESGNKVPGMKDGIMPNGLFNEGSGPIIGDEKDKCLKPTTFRLILMVLCPPFALFMKYGFLRGWFYIMLCGILTYYFYYFPGLLFACMHTLCF